LKVSTLLVVVLVVLAAVFLVIKFGTGRRGGEDPLFEGFAAGQAAGLSVATEAASAVLRKVNQVWFVTSEDSLPAEAGAVEKLLDDIAGFSRKDIISSKPDKYGLYQVDSAGVRVAVSDAMGDTLVRFVVGKPGPDFQSTYVRDVASGDVILAPGYLRSMFDRGKRSWQDRTIYAYKPDEVEEIEIRRPGETLTLRNQEGGEWFVNSPESAACDPDRVTRLIRTLANLKSDDFAGRMPVPASGLAESDSSVAFRVVGGIREELLFGNHGGDGRVFAKRADSDIVYLLSEYKVNAMLPRLAELRRAEGEVGERADVEKGP
jgi:hypothetical protein